MTTFEKARKFVYRNARPLDLARWQFHFEGGSADAVLRALAAYQNEDGGFGHGIEPDFLNPNSTPIGTWVATEILRELGLRDRQHPIVRGILRYLDSGADFSDKENQWYNTVPTNNDYPHAIWWEYKGEDTGNYNPTAALAAFIIDFAERDTPLYKRGCDIAREAVEWLSSAPSDNHVTACFIPLYFALEDAADGLADMAEFKKNLLRHVSESICHEREKWAAEYVAKPSDLFLARESIFYPDNAELAEFEVEHIKAVQLPDGSYTVPWQWWTDYKEYEVSANMWRSSIIIKNMRYLKGFNAL